MNTEMIIMELVVNAGNARSIAIEALRQAKIGDYEKAEELIQEADSTLLAAHNAQTDMIQNEVKGEKTEVSLLMVHAQDHLMNAITVLDLVKEMIDILKVKEK